MPTPIDPKKVPSTVSTPDSAHEAARANMTDALEDRSQYIRTMAKDMAGLSKVPPPAPQAPAPQKEKETVEGVTLDVAEQPFFEKQKSREEREAEEPVALPSLKEAGEITTSAPLAPPIATPESLEAERSAVLERLRRKVGESAQMSIQQSPAPLVPETPPTPPPAPPAPKPLPPEPPAPVKAPEPKPESAWSNIPSPAPAFAPLSEPAPSRLPPVSRPEARETYREPIEDYVPPKPLPPATPEALHTYTSDFSDRIDTKSASTFSVLAAEQDAQAKAPTALAPQRRSPKKAILAVASGIFLIVLAGGGIFFTYQFVMTMRDTPIAALTVPSIVFADEYRELEGTGSQLLQSLQAASNAALVPGNVLVTYILTSAETGDGSIVQSPAGGDVFMRALQVPAPDILLRNIAEQSTVGAIHAGAKTSTFFALRVDSYERTYAGMLTWEPLMARDLGLLYPLYPIENVPTQEASEPVATTTASSTVSVSTSTPPLQEVQAVALTRFEDAVVANRDVRILRDTRGRSLILYGYADKRTLLITRDESAFEALLSRLKTD